MNTFVQCWGCAPFDQLFQIISKAAAAAYEPFTKLCLILFCILFMVFVANALWKNMRNNFEDPFFQKSVVKVTIRALCVLVLLRMGVQVPQLITTVTMEPVAQMTLVFTQSINNTITENSEQVETYTPVEMNEENNFFRPYLRDNIIKLMETTTGFFQGYIQVGLEIIDQAFSWSALKGVGALIRHAIFLLIGIFLTWEFFKLFFRYCCKFIDVIVAIALFAFFFPLSMIMFIFQGAEFVPEKFSQIGKNVGTQQIKNAINAIVSLGSVVLTYTILMMIITRFFGASGVSTEMLVEAIASGQVSQEVLDINSLESFTLLQTIAMVYVLNFLYEQIPQVTKMILSAFNVSETSQYGDKAADDLMGLTKSAFQYTKGKGMALASAVAGSAKTASKDKTDDKDKPAEKPKDDKTGGK